MTERGIILRGVAIFTGALLAWFVGKALQVLIWRDGWDIGDRTDMAFTAATFVWALTSRHLSERGK